MLVNPTFKFILITIDIKDMLKGISRKDKHLGAITELSRLGFSKTLVLE